MNYFFLTSDEDFSLSALQSQVQFVSNRFFDTPVVSFTQSTFTPALNVAGGNSPSSDEDFVIDTFIDQNGLDGVKNSDAGRAFGQTDSLLENTGLNDETYQDLLSHIQQEPIALILQQEGESDFDPVAFDNFDPA